MLKIKEIEAAQRLPGGDRELEDAELAAGAEDPGQLGQGAVEVGDVAQPERDRGGVEARVGEGQGEGVGVEDRRLREPAGPRWLRARPSCGRNLGAASASIGRQKSAATISIPGAAQRQRLVAGAAAEVEDPRARGEDEGLGELAAPDAVERGRQQVVQEVVAAGDPAEHRPDPGGVLLLQLLDCGNFCEDFRPGLRHDVWEVYRGGRAALEARTARVRPSVRRLDSFPGDLYDFRLSALKCRIRSSPADPQNRFLR